MTEQIHVSAGLDLHKKFILATVLSDTGLDLHKKFILATVLSDTGLDLHKKFILATVLSDTGLKKQQGSNGLNMDFLRSRNGQ